MFDALVAAFSEGVCRVVEGIQKIVKGWLRPQTASLVGGAVQDAVRSKAELLLENALLRQQLIVLNRQVKRPQFVALDRLVMVWIASLLGRWKEAVLLIQPETLLRWHHDLFKRFGSAKSQHPRGKPLLEADVVGLIQQMAHENPLWGAERIRGELLKLGLRVSKRTIQKYLPKDRTPQPSQTWGTFLGNHAESIWACDFIQVTDVFFRSLFVFVMIELGSRRIVHVGVTRQPTDSWVAQQVREATPFGQGPRFLLRDNDCKYGQHVWAVTEGAGIEVLCTPIGAPKANATCERFIGSVRRECLDHLLLFDEKQGAQVMKQYSAYFNQERPHQGLGQRVPVRSVPAPIPPPAPPFRVIGRPVLKGLHHAYQWQTA